MNKLKIDRKKLIKIIIALIIILIAIAIFFVVTISKKEYSKNSMKEILEKENYTVLDYSSMYEDDKTITSYTRAKSKDNNYQIDFYVMSNEKEAKAYYETLKNQFEKESNGIKGKTTKNNLNYVKYTIEANSNYSVVVQVNKTITYINTNIKNKDNVNKLLEKLGY